MCTNSHGRYLLAGIWQTLLRYSKRKKKRRKKRIRNARQIHFIFSWRAFDSPFHPKVFSSLFCMHNKQAFSSVESNRRVLFVSIIFKQLPVSFTILLSSVERLYSTKFPHTQEKCVHVREKEREGKVCVTQNTQFAHLNYIQLTGDCLPKNTPYSWHRKYLAFFSHLNREFKKKTNENIQRLTRQTVSHSEFPNHTHTHRCLVFIIIFWMKTCCFF